MEILKKVLIELWNNDEDVPATFTSRCTGLDWFSEGVKNNVVAYIAVKVFGVQQARELLNEPDLTK